MRPEESLEDLMDIALTECERFFPAFQFVLWGGKAPADALAAAMLIAWERRDRNPGHDSCSASVMAGRARHQVRNARADIMRRAGVTA